VEITLTLKGYREYERVILAVFEYTKFLNAQQNKDKPQDYIINELNNLSAI